MSRLVMLSCAGHLRAYEPISVQPTQSSRFRAASSQTVTGAGPAYTPNTVISYNFTGLFRCGSRLYWKDGATGGPPPPACVLQQVLRSRSAPLARGRYPARLRRDPHGPPPGTGGEGMTRSDESRLWR